MQNLRRHCTAGSVVVARQRRWRVLDVEPGIDCSIVRLARDDGGGPPLALIAPFDLIQEAGCSDRPRCAHRRAVAATFAATLLGSHLWAAVPSALRCDIRILDFQLEPALALLRGECTRMLLADEVGLGKTVQAALVLRELRARHEADRVLIVVPAGLREQWARELHDRCGIEVKSVDAASLAVEGRLLPPWIDGWSLPGISLVSIDLVKRPEVLAPLERAVWDLVVIDEAHHVARASDRAAAAAALCGRARYSILITATPHGGDSGAFERLLRIGGLKGDPSPMRAFRRSRWDAGLAGAGRRSRHIRVMPDSDERRMHRALDRYTRRVWQETHDSSEARLAMIVLRKRALSSPLSLAVSADRRLTSLEDPAPASERQAILGFDDLDGEQIADDDPTETGLGEPGLRDASAERRMLEEVRDAARRAQGHHAKSAAVALALGRSPEPAIVFTEYRDTLLYLERGLRGETTTACLHGGLLPAARAAAIEAFVEGHARVLLATDAAAEGLNLHHRCRWVIHFELPWSTVRLEQRTGRVDRIGQPRRVHVWSLINAHTDEERVLLRLDARQALSEEEVARVVFGEPAPASKGAAPRAPVSAAAVAEAGRLRSLARLAAGRPVASARPLHAVVRRRGPFASLGSGRLVLFRVVSTDAAGQRIGAECLAIAGDHGRNATGRAAARILGRRLRRSVADRRRFARLAIARATALQSRLNGELPGPLQQSLFDRRAEHSAQATRVRVAEAVGRLRIVAARAAAALGRTVTRLSRVASFEIR
jgi:superfamily II DNA or RNA helicase